MLKYLAHLFSILFHPLLMVSYVLLVFIFINPYLFGSQDLHSLGFIMISVFSISVFFPLIAVLLMRMVGLIESIQMKDKMERIGPLIVTGIFYLWLFINIKQNNNIAGAYTTFVLGSTIALFIAFFVNSFSKVSLHAIGMGGLLAIMFIIRLNYSYDFYYLSLGSLGNLKIHFDVFLIIAIFIAGLVGSSRLVLSAHKPDELYGGYIIGIFSQIIALRILG